jgi:ribosomal protein S18 acetylase RimI-like enzyme
VNKHASDAVQLTHLYVSGVYRMSGTGKALINMILQSVGPNMEVGVLVSPNNLPALALYTQSRGRAFTGQRGSKPGDPCSIDGASGVLGYNAEGELVCQVPSSNDDPEKALSDAYRDHENYLNHAWRMK